MKHKQWGFHPSFQSWLQSQQSRAHEGPYPADSADQVATHPCHQASHSTNIKSTSLNTANSFKYLAVEDISDLDDTNYKTNKELPDILSGTHSESDSA